MTIFKSVEIGELRGLKDIRLEGLGQLNLITGFNGAGKSTVLEAMFMLSAPEKPELSLAVSSFRNITSFALQSSDMKRSVWDSLFTVGSDRKKASIAAVLTSGLRISIEMSPTADARHRIPRGGKPASSSATSVFDGPPSLRWISKRAGKATERVVSLVGEGVPDVAPPSRQPQYQAALRLPHSTFNKDELAERFGRMELDGSSDVLVESLQILDRRVRSIKTVYNRTGPFLHVDLGLSELLPITLMGGGFVALTEILIDMHESRNGLLLIDEVEGGFHHSRMADVWRVVADASTRFNTQVVATTHSLEFIRLAQAVSRESVLESTAAFMLYRIDRVEGGEAGVATFDSEDIESAFELGLDVR